MTHRILRELPRTLRNLLSKEPPEPLVVPLVSVDTRGLPHAALVSCAELLLTKRGLYLVHGVPSSTAENLEERGVCSLLFVDPEQVVFLKARARRVESRSGQALFRIELEEVRKDRPSPEEAGARIVSSLRFEENQRQHSKRISRRRLWLERINGAEAF